MSVAATGDYSGPFSPDGVATDFPFDFVALSAAEVTVLRLSAAGVQTVLTGYTVALEDDGTGTASFSIAPVAGDPIYIVSNPSFQQEVTFANQGAFSAKALGKALDRAAVRDIALQAAISRGVLAPPTEILGTLPTAASRAGYFLAFDADGLAIVASGTGADAGLRTDLAATNGPNVIGFDPNMTYNAGTLGAYIKSSISGSAVADETIAVGQLVNLIVISGVTHMRLANGSVPDKPAHGYCTVGASSGATGTWTRRGIIPGTSATTFAAALWLSQTVPGTWQSSAPANTIGMVSQYVGMVLPGLGVEFNPQPEIIL